MEGDLFYTLGKIAGIAGISIGFLLIIFRSIIKKKIFPTLTKDQSYKIIKLIIIFSFLIGVLGISGWIYLEVKKESPIVEKKDKFTFIPIENLENKLSNFKPELKIGKIITLRLISKQWNIDKEFQITDDYTINDLREILLIHFEFEKHVKTKIELPGWFPIIVLNIDTKTLISNEELNQLNLKNKAIVRIGIIESIRETKKGDNNNFENAA